MTQIQKSFITDCLWDKFEKCDMLSDVESLAEFCTELDLEELGQSFIKQWKKDWQDWMEHQKEIDDIYFN